MDRKRILLGDDDADFARVLGNRLKAHGYDVIVALDGYQALDFAVKHDPDLLILDINMPAGNGFSVHERLRNLARMGMKPLIFITGEDGAWVERSALEHGAFGFLRKPFESEDLMRLVRQSLGEERFVISA